MCLSVFLAYKSTQLYVEKKDAAPATVLPQNVACCQPKVSC